MSTKQLTPRMEIKKNGEKPIARAVEPSLHEMRTVMDRMFEKFLPAWSGFWPVLAPEWRWGFDVDDQADAITVRAEAPGFDAKDFDVQVGGNQLVIRAAHKVETEKKEERYYRDEREFYRAVTIPQGIDVEHVDARYENGVLMVKLPKTEEAKTHKVAVR
jgi:HSP20 family protein